MLWNLPKFPLYRKVNNTRKWGQAYLKTQFHRVVFDYFNAIIDYFNIFQKALQDSRKLIDYDNRLWVLDLKCCEHKKTYNRLPNRLLAYCFWIPSEPADE